MDTTIFSMQELESYDYAFPKSLIALLPARPRDAARLLVYDRSTGKFVDTDFMHIADFLPKGAVLVFNQTKVLYAKLFAQKQSGAQVNLLFTKTTGDNATALCNKPLKSGVVLMLAGRYPVEVVGKDGLEYRLKSQVKLAWKKIFDKYGQVPLPPYLKADQSRQAALKKDYQTVFAKDAGSVAAPTAGLHFTERLLARLRKCGVGIEFVTLHVGLGTFAKLTEDNFSSGSLHEESYSIAPAAAARLNKAKQAGRQIIAVGTTVTRTLESACKKPGKLSLLSGKTDLFIRPPYTFKFVDGLVTNFHVPKSSLMLLVSSMIGKDQLLKTYRYAVRKKYRLFSFGDGMLVR